MLVKIPKRLDLEVDFTGGDVTVLGMNGHIEIDTATGAVDVSYGQDLVGKVKVSLGAGSGELLLRDGSKVGASGWPRSINWAGPGQSRNRSRRRRQLRHGPPAIDRCPPLPASRWCC